MKIKLFTLVALLWLSTVSAPLFAQDNHNQLTEWLYKGDINGDHIEEYLQINGHFLTVYKPDFKMTPVLSHRFRSKIKRLVIGDFVSKGREKGKDQVAAILEDGSIQVFAISDDKTELWFWFSQANFIKKNERFQVGDFDADFADEIMVHNPDDGTIRFYEITGSAFFRQKRDFTMGNLGSANLKNKRILIANKWVWFFEIPNLIVVDDKYRQISYYQTAQPNGKSFTFWWGYTTRAYLYNADSKLTIANLDGGWEDNLIIRNTRYGGYRFYKFQYDRGGLTPLYGINTGQLPLAAAEGDVFPIKTDTKWKLRDNLLYVQEDNGRKFVFCGAAESNNQKTYWWGYTTDRPFITSNFSFHEDMTADQVHTLIVQHRRAYYDIFSCTNINAREREKVAKKYQASISHGFNNDSKSYASAEVGGKKIWMNFDNTFPRGNTFIAQTLIHEMMHCAGYSHPSLKDCSKKPKNCDNTAYFNSPPMRAELCITGGASTLSTCVVSEDGHHTIMEPEVTQEPTRHPAELPNQDTLSNPITLMLETGVKPAITGLGQNYPNPFKGMTFVEYQTPPHTQKVSIQVMDIAGKMIELIEVPAVQQGKVEIDMSSQSPGLYFYSLLLDGNVTETKKMILRQ